MKRLLAFAAALTAGAFGCHQQVEVLPPVDPVPIVPLSFEVNRLVSLECEGTAAVYGANNNRAIYLQSRVYRANLFVAFMEATSRSTNTNNGATTVIEHTSVTGLAARCPPEVVARIVDIANQEGQRVQ